MVVADFTSEVEDVLLFHVLQAHVKASTVVLAAVSLALGMAVNSVRARFAHNRATLPTPEQAPWNIIWHDQSDNGFMVTMGVTVDVFNLILHRFRPAWNHQYPQRRRGRKRIVQAETALAIALHFYNNPSPHKIYQQLFGLTPATYSRALEHALEILPRVLSRIPEARVEWPSEEKMRQYARLVEARRQPAFKNGFGFVDGLNLPVFEPSDEADVSQNAMYNGWLSGCYCSNLFVFAPDGTIIYAYLNAVGSWHDLSMAINLNRKLRDSTPEDMYIFGDTAFASGAGNDLKLKYVTPCKKTELGADNITTAEFCERLRRHRSAVSIRQAAEWGMHSIQATFGRLHVCLPNDPVKRLRTLMTVVHLFNLRARCIGLNQIRTVYYDDWVTTAEGIAPRLRRYYCNL